MLVGDGDYSPRLLPHPHHKRFFLFVWVFFLSYQIPAKGTAEYTIEFFPLAMTSASPPRPVSDASDPRSRATPSSGGGGSRQQQDTSQVISLTFEKLFSNIQLFSRGDPPYGAEDQRSVEDDFAWQLYHFNSRSCGRSFKLTESQHFSCSDHSETTQPRCENCIQEEERG